MSYVDSQKIDQLIDMTKRCGLKADEKGLRALVGYDDDPQEADDQIGLLLADSNRKAHYHHSVSYMAEKEQTFLDLIEAALKMLGIANAESKSEYVASSQAEDIEIRVDGDVYKFEFRYGYTSDAEVLAGISNMAAKHADAEIIEINGPDQSYVLFVPAALASFLDETFLYMKKV